jgi:murein DD-endopeptidase MepM/ murein hydrolase activator NlpD
MAGACWYPIDLLAPEGELSVVRWRDGQREESALHVGAYPYEVQYITLQDDSQVDLSSADLRRVQRENRMIAAIWSLESPRRFELPLGPPLASLPDGGRFGARRFFNNQPRSPHTGTDFTAAAGTPILSVAAGTVALTGDFFFSGKSVFVDHGDGLISMYFHMSGIAVEEGDEVERGEILGLVGQSGRATGPHLHFGVRWHAARVDPGLLLQPPETLPSLP